MSGIFDFEVSADDARDERRMHAGQVGAAGNLFYRHFAVDRATIESSGDVAEGDRARGFHRERAADFEAVHRAGLLDRDVAADSIAHRDGADAARVEIAANASDYERCGEIGDVEVAAEIFDLDGDAVRDGDHALSRTSLRQRWR